MSPRVTTLVSLLHQLKTQEDYASSNGQTQSRCTTLSMGLEKKISHENYCQCFLICPQHAKSLQSCPTLCDPMDCSLPGSSVQGIFQARVLEWGAIAFSEHIRLALWFLEPFDIIAWEKELLPKWLMITEIINKQSSSKYLLWTFGENVDSVQFSCSVMSDFVT